VIFLKNKVFINIIAMISLIVLTFVMNICSEKSYLVLDNYLVPSIIISLGFGIFLIFKNFFVKTIEKKNKCVTLISLYLTLCTGYFLYESLDVNVTSLQNIFVNFNSNFEIFNVILVIISLFSLFCGYKFTLDICYKIFKKIYKDTTQKEKKTVLFIWLMLLLLNIIWYSFLDLNFIKDDVIYSVDSYYVLNHMFPSFSWALDFRHVLYCFFTFPLYAVFATLRICLPFPVQLYPIFVSSLNSAFIILTSLLLKKITKNKMIMYLYLLSFPSLFFSIIIEKFQLCTFFIVLFIYLRLNNKKADKELEDFALIGAVGTISTSVFLGFWSHQKEGLKKIFSWTNIAVIFIGLSIVLGKLGVLFSAFEYMEPLNYFPIKNRFFGLTEMLSSCFFAPYYVIKSSQFMWQNPASYLNLFGLIILILCIISFVINRKDKFAQISFYWLGFSIFLFIIMDWFCQEAPLFNLYFSWAIIGLVTLFIEKILKNEKLKNYTYILIMILMATINIIHLIKVYNFFVLYF